MCNDNCAEKREEIKQGTKLSEYEVGLYDTFRANLYHPPLSSHLTTMWYRCGMRNDLSLIPAFR